MKKKCDKQSIKLLVFKQAVCIVLAAAAADDPHVRSVLAGEGAGGWREVVREVRWEARGAQPHHLTLRRLLPSLDHVSAVVEVREKWGNTDML